MRYYSIQFLRVVFMAMVLILHLRAYLSIYGCTSGTIFHDIPDAFMAAALPFFSISGFIMAYLIDTGYKRFLPRRLLRIYPTYFCGVAIALVINYLCWDILPGKGLAAAASLLPLGPVDLPLRVEWTLVYEIAYYLVITPFTLPRLRPYFALFLVIWGAAIPVAYFAFDMRQAYVFNTWRTILFSGYNFYFITGALVYYIQKKTATRHWSLYASALVIGSAITVASTWGRPLGVIKAIGETSLWSLCTAVCLYAVVKLEDTWRHRAFEAIADFGEFTYAYYLIHAVVLAGFFSILVYKLGWELNNATAFLALSVVLALGYWFGRLDLFLHNFFKRRLR
jgi:peptidoglycan/LPS O-acetylase OafA/YrhL